MSREDSCRPGNGAALPTRAVHAGVGRDPVYGSVTTPIYPSSTYDYPQPGDPPEYDYGRCDHPTRRSLEENLASLEGAHRAWACVSGMAAIQAVLFLLRSGDHVVAPRDAYAGTTRLFRTLLARSGVEATFVPMEDPEAVRAAIRPATRLLWLETPTNPMMRLIDLREMVAIAREHGLLTAADNTFLSPARQRPLEHGVDFVVHSTTKYLNGHSDVIGGAVLCREETHAEALDGIVRSVGVGQSPFDAWLVLRGVKTLVVRMAQHEANARQAAQFLEERPEVAEVLYPGLPSHPQHDLASRQQDGPGGMLSAVLDPARVDPVRFVQSTRVFRLAVSLGGVESLLELPYSMSHGSLEEAEKRAVGLIPELVRLSPGIEAWEDLRADLAQALAAAAVANS